MSSHLCILQSMSWFNVGDILIAVRSRGKHYVVLSLPQLLTMSVLVLTGSGSSGVIPRCICSGVRARHELQ